MTEYLAARKPPEPPKPAPKPIAVTKPEEKKQSTGSGIKKGFFNQPAVKKSKPKENVTTIKPKNPAENTLVFPEVQEAMQYTNMMQKGNIYLEWLNEDLLQRLTQNPKLAQGMTNPRLMHAVDELRQNPGLAKSKYANDAEVQEFFVEFSKLMAGHFGNLAEKKQQESTSIQQTDPEVREIMKDKDVKRLIKRLQSGQPIELNEFLFRNPALGQKIRVLIDKGLIHLNP